MPDNNTPQQVSMADLKWLIAHHATSKHLEGKDSSVLKTGDYGKNQFRDAKWGKKDLKIDTSDDLARYIDDFLQSPETVGWYWLPITAKSIIPVLLRCASENRDEGGGRKIGMREILEVLPSFFL